MKNKSVIISEKAHSELANISKSHNITIGKVVESMVYYFKRTGINPNDTTKDNPTARVQALDKRVVSFFKTQETDILKPMRSEVHDYHKKSVEVLKSNNENFNKRFDNLINEHEKYQTGYLLVLIKKSNEILGRLKNIENEIKEYKNAGLFTKLKIFFSHANK